MEQSLISASQKGDCNRVFFGTKTPTYRWLNGVRTIQVENDFDLNTAKKISITHKDPIVLSCKKTCTYIIKYTYLAKRAKRNAKKPR